MRKEVISPVTIWSVNCGAVMQIVVEMQQTFALCVFLLFFYCVVQMMQWKPVNKLLNSIPIPTWTIQLETRIRGPDYVEYKKNCMISFRTRLMTSITASHFVATSVCLCACVMCDFNIQVISKCVFNLFQLGREITDSVEICGGIGWYMGFKSESGEGWEGYSAKLVFIVGTTSDFTHPTVWKVKILNCLIKFS